MTSGYGQVFEKWRHAAFGDWQAYIGHDFVEGLKDGTLAHENFLYYLKQDYVFLIHFSRAWALAVVKAGSISEMKLCSATLDALVNHEMQLHIQTCASLGISEDELFNTPEASKNLAYTRYVLDAGYSGDFLDLLAALAPCVLGYGEIGKRLLAEKSDNNPYDDWIQTYGGAEYQEVCQTVGQLIDDAVLARLGDQAESLPRWQELQNRFTMATRLEVDFWQMGLLKS